VAPQTNYCMSTKLLVGQDASGPSQKTLIKFSLDQLLAAIGDAEEAEIENAWLTLYAIGSSNASPLNVSAYQLRRPFAACEANWAAAELGQAWGIPGCGSSTADHFGVRLDSARLFPTTPQWLGYPFSWNIASAVRGWIADPASNHGILLVSEGPAATAVTYEFSSAEHAVVDFRPALVVRYRLGSTPPAHFMQLPLIFVDGTHR